MKNTPFFSILVPVYNQMGKMDSCIASIKAQTFEDYEVVFVDDGSTDGSYEMLLGFAAEDNRFSVYRHEENRSLLCARYTGMANAEGKYLIFLDSDDTIVPDTLETIYHHYQKEPADIIRFGFYTEPGHYEIHPPESDEPFKDFIQGRIPPQITKNCVSAEIAKKAVAEITPFYCNSGEDTFMSGTIYSYAKSFTRLDRCFYCYKIVGGMSREKESLNMEKLERILGSLDNCTKNLCAFIGKHRPEYLEDCRNTCGLMYRYELCHFLLNAADERMAVEFLNRFGADENCDVFDYGCREVLPEYFKRRLGVYPGDKMKFNAF